jgi:hypothetical protein
VLRRQRCLGLYRRRLSRHSGKGLDVNAIARGAGIKHSYVLDSLASGPNGDVLEYEAELDVTDLAAENGSDLDGRSKTPNPPISSKENGRISTDHHANPPSQADA